MFIQVRNDGPFIQIENKNWLNHNREAIGFTGDYNQTS